MIVAGAVGWVVGVAMGFYYADKMRGILACEAAPPTYWTPQIATERPEGPKPPARD